MDVEAQIRAQLSAEVAENAPGDGGHINEKFQRSNSCLNSINSNSYMYSNVL